ncbi:MAG: type II secretion system protein GspL [Betaproteobacteria bacterium]
MATLLLRIPDLPRFDAATPVAWALVDNAGAATAEGTGALSSAPKAEAIVAVAPVGHLLFIETPLPAVSPAKRNALLRYAIEDKLTIDPSTVHAVVMGKSATTQHVVAAIDRTWLLSMLQWLDNAGFTPDSLVSSAAGITVAANEWAVVLAGHHGFAKRPDGFVYNLDVGSAREPPFGLTLALKEAGDRGVAPAALTLQSTPAEPALAAQWQSVLGLPVKAALTSNNLPLLLSAGRGGNAGANLLTGEFAPREGASKWLALLKPALTLLTLIVCVHAGFTFIDNWRLNRERVALEQEMTRLFKSAFPAAQAIVDPPLQMQRNLQQLKRERGVPADSDAPVLIAKLSSIAQALPAGALSITQLSVLGGIATLDAVLAGEEQRAALQRAVDGMPGAALVASADPKAAPLAVRITLRAGS